MKGKIDSLFRFKTLTCQYHRGDCYLVRDNGAVCRQRREHKRKRPLDDIWTFGKFTERHGYRKVCHTPVHRIVATAFHGEQPSLDHVVDHIDTNRMNNEPENLRWVTQLENIVDNPKTLRRIEYIWGSVDKLIADPNPAESTAPLTNKSWMIQAQIDELPDEDTTIDSLTPLAMQHNWSTPSEFPMCPKKKLIIRFMTIFLASKVARSFLEIDLENRL